MEIDKIDQTITTLNQEIQFIQTRLMSEKEDKKRKTMMKQINTINQITFKLLDVKNNYKSYREN